MPQTVASILVGVLEQVGVKHSFAVAKIREALLAVTGP